MAPIEHVMPTPKSTNATFDMESPSSTPPTNVMLPTVLGLLLVVLVVVVAEEVVLLILLVVVLMMLNMLLDVLVVVLHFMIALHAQG